VFTGAQPLGAAAEELLAELLEVASGGLTWGEVLNEGEEVVSRYGPVL
jgi:altronate dehydratase large subunit